MAFGTKTTSFSHVGNDVLVNENQHFTVNRAGGAVHVRYHFNGSAWQEFFRKCALAGVPSHWTGAFNGAEINNSSVAIKGGFAHEQFVQRYGNRIGDWDITLAKGRKPAIPVGSDKDTLSHLINGMKAGEFFHDAVDAVNY